MGVFGRALGKGGQQGLPNYVSQADYYEPGARVHYGRDAKRTDKRARGYNRALMEAEAVLGDHSPQQGFMGRIRHSGMIGNANRDFGRMGDAGTNLMNVNAKAEGSAQKRQAEALNFMRDAAYGRHPSVAENQLRAGLDQNLRGSMGLLASARGNAGVAGMLGANTAADMGAITNQQAAMLRAQEMADARAQYGDMTNQLRNQAFQGIGMGADMMTNATRGQLGVSEFDLNRDIALADQQRLDEDRIFGAARGIIDGNNAQSQAQRQQNMALTGGILGGIGAPLASWMGRG